MLKKTAEGDSEGGRLKLGSLFRSKRKTMLLSATAIMLALAGMQLGKAFFADREVAELTAPDGGIQSAAMAPAALLASQPEQEVADTVGNASPVRTVDATERSPLETASPATEGTAAVMPAHELETEASAPPQPQAATPTATLKPELQDEDSSAADLPTGSTPAPVAAAAASPIPVPVEAGPVPLREAAEAGDSKAIFEIGSRYADGRGVKSDMKQAAEWYEKSAELGFAPAQYRIGNLYEKGTRRHARRGEGQDLVPDGRRTRATPAPCTIWPFCSRWAQTASPTMIRPRAGSPRQPNSASRTASSIWASWPPRASA